MIINIDGEHATGTEVALRAGHGIQVTTGDDRDAYTSVHTPAQARKLAAALLRAADEAEGK